MFNAIAVLLLLLFIPGATIAVAAGMRIAPALVIGPAITFALSGLAAWGLGALDISYNPATAALCWLLLIVVALICRLFTRRLRDVPLAAAAADDDAPETYAADNPTWQQIAFAAGGVVISTATLMVPAFVKIRQLPLGIASIQQTWDTLWHASVIRSILDNGVASATQMGEIQNVETQAPTYYPAAWHDLGAVFTDLLNLPVPDAITYLGIIIPSVLIPLGAAALAWRIVDRPGWFAAVSTGIAALVAGVLPVLMPIGIFVSAWPYQVAMALVGSVFWVLASLPRKPHRIVIAALALVGLGQVHPSGVPTVALITVVWWLGYQLWNPARKDLGVFRSRLRDLLLLASPAISSAALLLPQWLVGQSLGEDIKEFSATEDVTRAESWAVAVEMLTRHMEVYRPYWLMLALALVGALLLTFGPSWIRRAWVVPMWAISIVFVVHALNNFGTFIAGPLKTYNTFHYDTPHRLIMTTAYFVSAAAGAGTAAIARWCAKVSRTWAESRNTASTNKDAASLDTAPVSTSDSASGATAEKLGILAKPIAMSLLVSTIAAACIVPYGILRNRSIYDFAYKSPREWAMISGADLHAFDWLAKQPEAMQHRTFTIHSEGSGWMYSRNHLPVVFPHYDWPDADEQSATAMLYWHGDFLGSGVPGDINAPNDVDKAADKLDVAFLYISPPNYWADQEPNEKLTKYLWGAPGVTPVYKDKEVIIYARNSMVSDQRIDEMRAQSPEVLPPSATRGWSDGRVS